MKNIMLVGKFPSHLPATIDGEVYSLMRSLNSADGNAVITVVENDSQRDGEAILMYGFHIFDPTSNDQLPYKIMKETGVSTILVNSICQTIGEKSVASPRLVIFTERGKISKIIAGLKSLRVGCDVEIHLVGSYVPVDVRCDFYVQVKLLQKEAEHFKDIIGGLLRLGITREHIWASIIYDFVPADKLK